VARAYSYLAQFNPAAAQRVAFDIYEAADILVQHPYVGRGILGGRRELVAGSYVIVYRVRAAETRILRVWHGAQDRPR
jgi:toxin ParE1/3/4